ALTLLSLGATFVLSPLGRQSSSTAGKRLKPTRRSVRTERASWKPPFARPSGRGDKSVRDFDVGAGATDATASRPRAEAVYACTNESCSNGNEIGAGRTEATGRPKSHANQAAAFVRWHEPDESRGSSPVL